VFGADHVLADEHFDRAALRDKVGRFQPRVLAFTSKRAGSELLGRAVAYGLQSERIGATRLFVLPSPSGRARPHWDVRVWHELARLRHAK
jgi:TDG/mug DNA glycosylase family protein